MARSRRVTGIHPLSYMGVEATTPPQLIESRTLEPTSEQTDVIGTLWLKTETDEVWMLTDLSGGSATWTKLSNDALTINADTGTAVEADGEIDIIGSGVLATSGAADVLTIGMTAAIDGQLIIAGTGIDPAWGTVTSSDGTITITGGPNTLDITRTGGGGTTDFITDAGTANSVGSQINILGGSNINTAGAGMTVTVNLDNAVTITGQMTSADLQVTNITAGFLESDGAGNISNSEGTDGQVPIAATGAPAVWANLTSTSGTIQVTEGANTLNIESLAGLASPYLYNRTVFTGTTGTVSNISSTSSTFVVCTGGATKTVWSSTTGLASSWTLRGTALGGTPDLVDIHCASGGPTVAISGVIGGGPLNYAMMHSATPTGAYTTYKIAGGAGITYSSVNFGNTYWVITAYDGANNGIYYDTDPTSTAWTFNNTGITQPLNDSAYGNSTWVVVGDSGYIGYQATDPTGAWTAVAPSSSGFDTLISGTPIDIGGVAYSPTLGLFCAVGTEGRIATSPDGITWTQRIQDITLVVAGFTSCSWDAEESIFIVGGGSTETLFSYNGILWDSLPALENGNLFKKSTSITGTNFLYGPNVISR